MVINWLVVSTHLKNISQNGFIFPKVRGEHKKYLSCQHLVKVSVSDGTAWTDCCVESPGRRGGHPEGEERRRACRMIPNRHPGQSYG